MIFLTVDEDTETQRGEVTCPGIHSREVAEVGMNLSSLSLSQTLSLPGPEVRLGWDEGWKVGSMNHGTGILCTNLLFSKSSFVRCTGKGVRRASVCACACMCVCVCVYVCLCACVCMHVHLHVCACMYMHVYVYACACMPVCTCVHGRERVCRSSYFWQQGNLIKN